MNDETLKALEKEEEQEPEMVEPVKPNRHERRKRAKLARRMAVKEKLEAEARKNRSGLRSED